MTTVSTFQGLQGEKTTSRVLQPPGGGSSNIFGTESQGTAAGLKANAIKGNNIFGPIDTVVAPPRPREDTNSNIFGVEASPSKKTQTDEDEVEKENNTDAANTKEEQGAGEQQPAAAAAPKVTETAPTIVRVRQPPGGQCSKLW